MARTSAKDVILDTAERLFAEQGMESVSLRTINTEAGYSVAALHYHFGNREKLIDAMVKRRQKPILARRQELIDILEAEEQPDIYRITEALVLPMSEPILENPEQGLRTIKFFFRMYVDQSSYGQTQEIIEESHRIFIQLLKRAIPDMEPELLHQRWVIASELTFQGLANIDNIMTIRSGKDQVESYRHYINRLIAFIAGGIGAAEYNP